MLSTPEIKVFAPFAAIGDVHDNLVELRLTVIPAMIAPGRELT